MLEQGTDNRILEIPSMQWHGQTLKDVYVAYNADWQREDGIGTSVFVRDVELRAYKAFNSDGTRAFHLDKSGLNQYLAEKCRQDYQTMGSFGLQF